MFHIQNIRSIHNVSKTSRSLYVDYLLNANNCTTIDRVYVHYSSPVREFKTIIHKANMLDIKNALKEISNDKHTYVPISLTKPMNKKLIKSIKIGENNIVSLVRNFIAWNDNITLEDILLVNNISYDDDTLLTISYYENFDEHNIEEKVSLNLKKYIDNLL